jgi:hypothetical protein
MRDQIPSQAPSYHLFTQPTDPAELAARSRPWSGDSFSFHDLLDTINPLQHIPVISTVYRYLTGDSIGAVPRMLGDALYGGPIGFVTGLAGAVLKQESGKDPGETMIAMVTGDDSVGSPKTVVAETPKEPAIQASALAAIVPAAAPVTDGAGPVRTATTSTGAGTAAIATTFASPASGGIPPTALPLAPPRATAAPDGDPRAALHTRIDALRRQSGSDPTRPQSTREVPLQPTVLPGLARGRISPASAAATPVSARMNGTDGPPPSAQPVGPATAPTQLATPDAVTPVPISALPSNPPIDISQQMMDALDKYARMQQQRSARDAGRGGQVNLTQ